MKMRIGKRAAGAALVLGLIIPQAAPMVTYADVMNNNEDIVNLRIVETTDIHSNVMSYDYYKGAPTKAYGLAKAATLIKEVRAEADNSLLFDNGDIIQGSPISEYVVDNNLMKEGYIHPVFKAMNQLGYDAGTLGNHEFNYGLDFLNTALKGAEFPHVNANVYDMEGNNYFTPYEILEREVKDTDGDIHKIKIGVTGFVPQGIMGWDEKHLKGKVQVEDIVESAKKVVPKMKEAGADVVVVLSHSGITDYEQNGDMKEYVNGLENASYYLSQVEDIDAILTGHQHLQFPNPAKPSFADGNGIDNTKGTINGVPTVMPGKWGDNIGLVDLTIEKIEGEWDVTSGQAKLDPITVGDTTAEDDPGIVKALKEDHEATIKFMETPVGELKGDVNTYFGLVKDNAAMEILNRAQTWYVKRALKDTEDKDLPVISAAAPFKAGRNGAEDFTNIKSGNLVLKNIADLYYYDNNVVNAVKVNGSDLKEWLEWSSGQFNTIDPSKTEDQPLINKSFPNYNFDVIDGVTYEVDVTSLPKYDKDQNLINPDANRIKNLQFNGKPVTEDMEFIVATNDYRASGLRFMSPDKEKTIYKFPDSNREAMKAYVAEKNVIDSSVNNNWTFAPVKANVTFLSNPKAEELASKTNNISYTGVTDENGFGVFKIDLNKGPVRFEDVPADYWAADYINNLADQGIIKGKTSVSFEPDSKITRGQFASLLVRSLGLTAKSEAPFKDVSGELANEVAAAYEAGITTGTSAATFEPFKPISRAQMATMLIRAFDNQAAAEENYHFTDIGSLQPETRAAIQKAFQLEFIKGYGNEFKPANTATRAQAAKVVYLLNAK